MQEETAVLVILLVIMAVAVAEQRAPMGQAKPAGTALTTPAEAVAEGVVLVAEPKVSVAQRLLLRADTADLISSARAEAIKE